MNTEEEIRELWEDQTHFDGPRRCSACGGKTLYVVCNNHDCFVQCLDTDCYFYDDTHDDGRVMYFPTGRFLDGRGNE